MNKNELLKILNDFPSSKDNVILVDGKWGSGKTYLLNEFIKSYKKHPIYYVSLLAKRSIDDINTSLYMEANKDVLITANVPVSVSPFKNQSSLDYILKLDHKCSAIVIFDDLERYGSSDYDELLSYITFLSLKGIKTIVVSNLLSLGNGERYNFEQYKEKIFDHVYKADLFETSLLERKLGDNYKYFDDDLILHFNHNIRVVDKVSNFLETIMNYLPNNIKNDENHMKNIIFYMIFTITSFYNEIPILYSKLKNKADYRLQNKLFSYLNDEDSRWDTLKIYEYSLNTESKYKIEDPTLLIASLYELYIYGKNDLLLKYIEENKNI